jgi:hypothetical protein
MRWVRVKGNWKTLKTTPELHHIGTNGLFLGWFSQGMGLPADSMVRYE